MTLGSILLIILILMLVGVIPTWPYSRGWGYAPSGILGIAVADPAHSVADGPNIALI